jgi:hypothetical protein
LVETCQSGAAGTMAGVTEWPPEQLNENLSCVCTALTRRMQLSEEMRLRLLETFMHLAVRDTTINSRLSGEKIGAILTEAFLLELSRPESKQSLEYGSELLCQMKDYRYPAAAEVLQVVVESHWSPALRDLAGQVLDSLKDSLQCQWDATVFDDKATADMRVESLALAVRERDAKRLLKAIFSNLKGCRFTGATDRRMRIINKLFAHPNDLIRLATCFALVKSNDYNDSIETLVPAIALLADLAVNSRTPSVMADAVTLIEWLKQQHSHSRDQIAQACATANAKFIKVQMQALERVH